ncbi:MAG: type II secretion system protein GspM [Brevundimonas sp.]|jgi:type II secretory pathway component PulM|uniref:type II secretion system protein GspM n=1 Tax=Brevundimonas sp. TaxID=1871086 RepID=UPI00391CA108
MIEALKTRWLALTARERWMLGLGAAVVLAVAFWYTLASPLRHARATAQDRAAAARSQHVRAVSDAAVIEAERARRQGMDLSRPLEQTALDLAASTGLSVERHDVAEDGSVTVHITGAGTGALFGWLAALENGAGIGTANASVVRGDAGLDAQVTLSRVAQ